MDFRIGTRVRNREGDEGVVTQVVPGKPMGDIEQTGGPVYGPEPTEYAVRRDDGTTFTAAHDELVAV